MEGFDSITFCQTSDYVVPKDKSYLQVKYSVFAIFKKELGLIKVRDILVTKTDKSIEI
jgi:hypothetical protein